MSEILLYAGRLKWGRGQAKTAGSLSSWGGRTGTVVSGSPFSAIPDEYVVPVKSLES